MVAPKVLILRAPGTNCDVETGYAFELVGAKTVSVHINQLIAEPEIARDCQILCFPGGFSYGDDIAAGRILAQRLNVHLREVVDQFCAADRLVLGICNGFQVMMRLGIFFPGEESDPPATLTLNQQARFEDRWVHLKTEQTNSVFLAGIDRIFLPMAHAEGRFVAASQERVARLHSQRQLGLKYCDMDGRSDAETVFPANPNGSQFNVAGISDPTGRILGLMPHPERYVHVTQHPFWTRFKQRPEFGEGRQIFANAVQYFV